MSFCNLAKLCFLTPFVVMCTRSEHIDRFSVRAWGGQTRSLGDAVFVILIALAVNHLCTEAALQMFRVLQCEHFYSWCPAFFLLP